MTTQSLTLWSSALSRLPDTEKALEECVEKIRAEFQGKTPDILFLFVSPHHREAYQGISTFLGENLAPLHMLGCSAGGVIGEGREVEGRPALSLTAALLPGVEIKPFRFTDRDMPDLDGAAESWEELIGLPASQEPQLILLADPFSVRAEEMLNGLDYAFPQSSKVGGLASGARRPGGNALYLDGEIHNDGALGLALTGNIRLDTLVAQGCRPLGPVMTVTRCGEHLLHELNGRKALDVIEEIYGKADPKDKELLSVALFLGLVNDPLKKGPPEPGDFLIRNVMGVEQESRGLIVGAPLRQGQTVQFHVRDGAAAHHDLEAVLSRYAGSSGPRPLGALLFSCLGRGEHMYGEPDHDSKAFSSRFAGVPLGGFFCNGEIGPVGGNTYIHGFTSCFGIFRPK